MGVADLPRDSQQNFDSGPIGFMPRRFPITISTVKFDEAVGGFVYGAEIDADFVLVTHDFLRKASGRSRVVAFSRYEIRVRVGASADISARATVFLSEMPAGQRRVHKSMLQSAARGAPPQFFEDIKSFPAPLDDAASRSAASDDEAIRALHTLGVNLFETQRFLVAGFVSSGAGALMSYDDQDPDEKIKWRETKMRLAGATYSIGAVSDPKAVHAAIWKNKSVYRAYQLADEGHLRVKASATGPEIAVPLEVAGRAVDHMEIAIAQAMAGAGEKAREYIGRPVALYAQRLFERHLYTAAVRLAGRLPPIVDGEFDDGLPPRRDELPESLR
jgi:hypothetical protein